ncbi:MAG: C40 family peptidase [Hyphomicrobiales bacterium]
MTDFDPRLTPFRADLAADYLTGKVDAARFVAGQRCAVIHGAADIRRLPVPDAPLDTEALFGEIFTVYEMSEEGWSWGQLACDGYVGYMPSSALISETFEPTHRVAVLRTFLYGGPSIKLPPIAPLSLGSRINVKAVKNGFAVTDSGHFVFADHLVQVGVFENDFVTVAERFLGLPYYWGGKTSLGIDCSGLVQVCLDAIGVNSLRDTDMQAKSIGFPVPIDEVTGNLMRGDLIFWNGHVAIMQNSNTLLHASGHHMLVVSESLMAARDRISAKGGGSITSIRRLIR